MGTHGSAEIWGLKKMVRKGSRHHKKIFIADFPFFVHVSCTRAIAAIITYDYQVLQP